MNVKRRARFLWILFYLLILALCVGLVLYALRQNLHLYYTPSQLLAAKELPKRPLRIGGMVVKHSVEYLSPQQKNLGVRFRIQDEKNMIRVSYYGILPDLFREGQGIVALGNLQSGDDFLATEVLAKHDADYMPPGLRQKNLHPKQSEA